MKINLIEINGVTIAEIISEKHEIKAPQDALDIVGNSIYKGAYQIIIHEQGLTPEFFDLSSGLAGEILQKFSNYNSELAIVGDFSKYTSQSLQDFIRESNQKGAINFVSTIEEAQSVLTKPH